MEQHDKYKAQLSNISEENKIQAIMLGHIRNSFMNESPAYYQMPHQKEVVSQA